MPQSKQSRCSAPDIALPISGNYKSNIKGLKGYYYEEMIKRLNSVDEGRIGSVGYFLRRLWQRHEGGFAMRDAEIYGEWHEQSQKANRDEFERKHKRGEIGFRKSGDGAWGVYSDLLYDTYQKDWSKAYQLTFFCFFRNMDYLSNYIDGEFFSYVHRDFRFFAYGRRHQFGEAAIKDVENFLGDSTKVDALHALPKHDKAPMYDIICKVLGGGGSSRERFRHGQACWIEGNEGGSADLPKSLAMDVFAHMASSAVVNPKAFDVMRKCLPNAHEMFIDILRVMVLRLEEPAIRRYYGKPTGAGDLFYKFLSDNFPFRGSGEREKFNKFMEWIYGRDACGDLGWLHSAIIGNSLPKPSLVRIDAMEGNVLGAYKDNVIYINQHVATNSMHSQEICFILLLAMLHEYGHFLDGVLRERAGLGGGGSEGEKGKAFAERFMEYSAAGLFSKPSFEFADLKVPEAGGGEQTFTVGISSLDYKRRKGIFCFFEYSECTASGDLELLSGETINDVEFFSPEVHIELTRAGAGEAGVDFDSSLWMGCIWPDFPFSMNLERYRYVLIHPASLATLTAIDSGQAFYESHFGQNQHWHSMYPESTENLKNKGLKEKIIDQAKKWYSEAIEKKTTNKHESLLALGKLCHMVQDGFCLSHCWRRYVGDEEFIPLPRIDERDNEKIWAFQDYKMQDRFYHAISDNPKQKNEVQTIGYKSAERATKEIMKRYAKNLEWYKELHENNLLMCSLEDYLTNKIYGICRDREDFPSGGSHWWFKKNNQFYVTEIPIFLTRFSYRFWNF